MFGLLRSQKCSKEHKLKCHNLLDVQQLVFHVNTNFQFFPETRNVNQNELK